MSKEIIETIYYNGKHYDSLYADLTEDIPFWIAQARRYGGPVLELGCGTGRISIPLAREFQVTGIDISDSMLQEAQRKSLKEKVEVKWVKGDIRSFELDESFSLVIIPANTMGHLLKREDLRACLSCVRRQLRCGGRFIIDVHNPDLEILARDPEKRYRVGEYPDPESGEMIMVEESGVYDRASQIRRFSLHFEFLSSMRKFTEEFEARMWFPQEISALLRYEGFGIKAKYGSFRYEPFDPSSPRQIIVCSPRQGQFEDMP